MTRLTALSKSFGSCDAPTSRAVSRKRAYSASRLRVPGFGGAFDFALRDRGFRFGADLRGMAQAPKQGEHYCPPCSNLATQYCTSSRYDLKRYLFFSTSRSIGQPLADCPCQGDLGTAHVVHAKPLAGILPEIELAQVAVKMPFGNVLIGAEHSPLKHAEKALKGIAQSS